MSNKVTREKGSKLFQANIFIDIMCQLLIFILKGDKLADKSLVLEVRLIVALPNGLFKWSKKKGRHSLFWEKHMKSVDRSSMKSHESS